MLGNQVHKTFMRKQNAVVGREPVRPCLTHKADGIDLTLTDGVDSNAQSEDTVGDSDGIADEPK